MTYSLSKTEQHHLRAWLSKASADSRWCSAGWPVQDCLWSRKRRKGLRTVWAADLLIIKKTGGGPFRAVQSTSGQQIASDSFNGRTCFSEPCCPYSNDTLLTTTLQSGFYSFQMNKQKQRPNPLSVRLKLLKEIISGAFLTLILCLYQARIKRNVCDVSSPL